MALTFDTESRYTKEKAPPYGRCHVCREAASRVLPDKEDGRSYEVVGMFMDTESAIAHGKFIAPNEKQPIVVFDFGGKEIYRSMQHAAVEAAKEPKEPKEPKNKEKK